MKSRLEIAIEALEYYSSPEVYEDHFTLQGNRGPGIIREGGAIARQALKDIRKVMDPIPYREPSDWDHHNETPEEMAERDALIERKKQ